MKSISQNKDVDRLILLKMSKRYSIMTTTIRLARVSGQIKTTQRLSRADLSMLRVSKAGMFGFTAMATPATNRTTT